LLALFSPLFPPLPLLPPLLVNASTLLVRSHRTKKASERSFAEIKHRICRSAPRDLVGILALCGVCVF
jgi:hypothetical protein